MTLNLETKANQQCTFRSGIYSQEQSVNCVDMTFIPTQAGRTLIKQSRVAELTRCHSCLLHTTVAKRVMAYWENELILMKSQSKDKGMCLMGIA